RCFEIRGLRLARAEALLGDSQPGTTVDHFGRELPQLRLALVELGKLLLGLLEPSLLLTDIPQPVGDLGLGDRKPARPVFELFGDPLDSRFALVDRCRSAPRVLL